jgi:hypothetical protein
MEPWNWKLLMEGQVVGRFLIAAGFVLIVVGLLSYVLPLFRLLGDIRYEDEHFTFYFPIVSCIVISIILPLLFNFLKK